MIQICQSPQKIKEILSHPKVLPWVIDDGCININKIDIKNPRHLWLINKAETGLVLLEKFNSTTCIAHISTLPKLWGRARNFVKDIIEWGFKNTLYYKVLCFIPANNQNSLKLVQDLGFKKEGRLKQSILQQWIFYDQIIYSLLKEGK